MIMYKIFIHSDEIFFDPDRQLQHDFDDILGKNIAFCTEEMTGIQEKKFTTVIWTMGINTNKNNDIKDTVLEYLNDKNIKYGVYEESIPRNKDRIFAKIY